MLEGLRAGLADEALRIARQLRKDDPDEQYLIACEVTALRILGDPDYRRWADFERLVRCYDLPTPQGFFTVQNFNASLGDTLRAEVCERVREAYNTGADDGQMIRHDASL